VSRLTNARPVFWQLLTAQQREALAAAGQTRRYAPGDVLIGEHEHTDHVVVIRGGCVKVATQAVDGYEAVLALRDGGDLVGELAGLDGGPRSATLRALTYVEALVIPAARFAAFRAAHPSADAALHRVVSSRLREADQYRTAAGAQDTAQRLAVLLLDLAGRYGVAQPEGTVIGLPLGHDDFAGLILTSTRTVARILERWRASGWVLTGRRSITVTDLAALRRLADG
jgi:CRP/FNR family transcriptional regulator, cyclic AMP receptor protein